MACTTSGRDSRLFWADGQLGPAGEWGEARPKATFRGRDYESVTTRSSTNSTTPPRRPSVPVILHAAARAGRTMAASLARSLACSASSPSPDLHHLPRLSPAFQLGILHSRHCPPLSSARPNTPPLGPTQSPPRPFDLVSYQRTHLRYGLAHSKSHTSLSSQLPRLDHPARPPPPPFMTATRTI